MSHVDLFTIVTHPEVCDASPFSSGSYSLYTSFNVEIVIDESKYGLKGPHNLALGNPPTSGGALGLGKEHENRPRDNVHK